MKKAILSVTNDLSYDQRVHKVALTLQSIGYDVLLVGRKRKKSEYLTTRPYETRRLTLLFEKGPLFYLEYNIRLFFFLIQKKATVFIANDLDTLLANYLATLFKKTALVYDSHELFTEVPELQNKKFSKRIWLWLERCILPNLKHCYTVSESISGHYKKKYGTHFMVIRNVPVCIEFKKKSRDTSTNKIVLYQGSVNKGRGVDLMIRAMKHLNNVEFWVVGEGDELQRMMTLADEINVHEKVKFYGGILFEDLVGITSKADLGISFESMESLSYKYALPNKVFDYIQMEIPILVSPLVEVETLINKYKIGAVIDILEPVAIAAKITEIFENTSEYEIWKENTKVAAEELCWKNEHKKLIEFYENISPQTNKK